ncbi:tRNA pseudouridine synthase B [Clostridia bacterium]|nr:tRNA pseudouridine synthase B [Clostridia bacterium]
MNGILNINKEAGYTSHDVVARLRGILQQKKIGHTGTLDPQAIGVLPVCLGKATKVADLLTNTDKTYACTLLLGKTTDTYDMTGRVLAEAEVAVSIADVSSAIAEFVGAQSQIPPMYSALKVNGKKLYELARAGKEVERTPRSITIYEIAIRKINLPRVELSVRCSKGTYIRTLCHDIGTRLGCGGSMESLIRTEAAGFRIEDSLKLSEVEELVHIGKIQEALHPIDSVFLAYESRDILPEYEKALRNGNALPREALGNRTINKKIRVYDESGNFAGIYEWQEEKERYQAVKLFL